MVLKKSSPDIKNFEFAKKNGFKGSFEEWRNASNVQRNQPRVVGSGGALVGPDGKVQTAHILRSIPLLDAAAEGLARFAGYGAEEEGVPIRSRKGKDRFDLL